MWLRVKEPAPQTGLDERAGYTTWTAACLQLPSNREATEPASIERLPLKEVGPLYRLVDAMVAQTETLRPWIGNQDQDAAGVGVPFRPFAQKLSLPPNSRIVVHGDLHGDIRSLIVSLEELQKRKILTGFKVTAPNTHLIFLGDYIDRGYYGVEVLYTLMRLKLENPLRVWLTRGNHEDLYMTRRYGFEEEGQTKYGNAFKAEQVAKLFDGLPSVVYIGSNGNFLQSCHGGMEPGYDPGQLLDSKGYLAYQRLGKLTRAQFRNTNASLFEKLVERSTASLFAREFIDFVPLNNGTTRDLGFMWHDFTLYQNASALDEDVSLIRMEYGQALTLGILEAQSTATAKIRGVLRAHQHSRSLDPMMKRLLASNGIYRHWQEREVMPAEATPTGLEADSVRPVVDGGVYTFNVSPDSVYGKGCNYHFQTFGILTLTQEFEDWRMEVVNLEVSPLLK